MRSSEWLLYVLLIAAVFIFNLVMQFLAKRARQRRAEVPPPGEAVPFPGLPPDGGLWGRLPEAAEPVATPSPAAAARRAAPAQAHLLVPARRASGRLGSSQDLRRAITLMTILGPCRALAPHQSPDSERGG